MTNEKIETTPKAGEQQDTLEAGATDLAEALHGGNAAAEKYPQPTPVAQTVEGTLIGDPNDHPEKRDGTY